MKLHATGTVERGQLKLDDALDLPDRTRVNLVVEAISETAQSGASAWASLQQRLRERPIHSGGIRFTRDQLHERR
jgi:hypothetical protein